MYTVPAFFSSLQWWPPILCSFFSRIITVWSFWYSLLRWRGDADLTAGQGQLLDDVRGGLLKNEANGTTPKRRALLVGISYKYSLSNECQWEELDGPHIDVKQFQELLINTYGYYPEAITVLRDDPDLSDHFQPTRVNMLHELRRLVAGAAPGDRFTFLYSGHSDQQSSYENPHEEDGQDEATVIITSDLQRIADNELNAILVNDLPVGCTLLSILDACYSGTMLDLPHYRCNNVYVSWPSTRKDEHCTSTYTYQNKMARANALGLADFRDSSSRLPTPFTSAISNHLLDCTPSGSPLRISTKIGSTSSTSQRKTSMQAGRDDARNPQDSSFRTNLSESQTLLYDPPMDVVRCDGWCGYDIIQHATVLSLSACVDLQRAWEGPRGSLTAVLCRFLEKHPNPSYRTLMSHVNFQLYENCRSLHECTRGQEKEAVLGEGSGFDGELNNFQTPRLSSLAKLNMDDVLRL